MLRVNSLRTRLVALAALGNGLLLSAILLFLYFRGAADIRQRGGAEAEAAATAFEQGVREETAAISQELTLLKTRLAQYPLPDRFTAPGLLPLQEFITGYAPRYVEVSLADPRDGSRVTVTATLEFGQVQALTSRRPDSSWLNERLNRWRIRQRDVTIAGPDFSTRLTVIEAITRLDTVDAPLLVAVISPESLSGRVLARHVPRLPLTALVSEPGGIILAAPDPAWLRQPLTILPRSAGWPLPEQPVPAAEQGAAAWRKLAAPALHAAFRVDLAAEWRQLYRNLLAIALFTGGAAMAAAAGVWLMTSRLAAVLAQLTGAARRLAAGQYQTRLTIRRADELGLFINTFNHMAGRLAAGARALRRLNRQLRRQVAELTAARREISRRERLSAVGEALAAVSHEIQNRVGGLSIWVQNLEKLSGPDPRLRNCTGEIRQALARFMEMLAGFKQFYREPRLTLQILDLSETAAEAAGRLRDVADARQVPIIVERSGEDPLPVRADRELLLAAVENLLLNALDATPPGSAVTVLTRRQDTYGWLAVLDRGPGIPPADRRRIFQPFYTTKAAGSGLGLAITDNIIRAHGGSLQAGNRRGGGAWFRIRLPRSEEVIS